MERKDYIATIQELLKGVDGEFDGTNPMEIKMIRHADGRTKQSKRKAQKNEQQILISGKPFPANITSIYALYIYRKELFMQYQSEQKASNIKDIKYIVSFIGEEGTTARFVGIYKIIGRSASPHAKDEVILELQPIKAFETYEKRIVIDWVSPANSWHQYYNKEKPVIKIEENMPNVDATPLFKSYLEVILNHAQLQLVINNPNWVCMLKEVNCIYAILDVSNGKLYVGSTYNPNGIWDRWSKYAATGHGGDLDLIVKGASDCKNDLKWCILETLPLDVSAHDAIERENLWKEKLGARVFGYCNN